MWALSVYSFKVLIVSIIIFLIVLKILIIKNIILMMKRKKPGSILSKDGSYRPNCKTGVYSKGQEDNVL